LASGDDRRRRRLRALQHGCPVVPIPNSGLLQPSRPPFQGALGIVVHFRSSSRDNASSTYAYDSANQLRYGQAAGGRTTYTFDNAGNQEREVTPLAVPTLIEETIARRRLCAFLGPSLCQWAQHEGIRKEKLDSLVGFSAPNLHNRQPGNATRTRDKGRNGAAERLRGECIVNNAEYPRVFAFNDQLDR
jgi:hypothetical protein